MSKRIRLLQTNSRRFMKDDSKKKDVWDKAAIISGFASSVVIAGVGLLLNASLQDAQRISAEQNAKAQIEVAERNAKLQIDQAAKAAESQKQLQESALTAQLVEHLASDNPVKRKIAIVALQSAVPPAMYQNVISVVVATDPSSDVRVTAYQQVETLREPGKEIIRAIAEAAQDQNKPEKERNLARQTAGSLAIWSAAPPNTAVIAAAGPNEAIPDRSTFTGLLVRGLDGEADLNSDGNVTVEELSFYLRANVPALSGGRQNPVYWRTGFAKDDIILAGKAAKIVALIIGNDAYQNNVRLEYPVKDALDLNNFLMQHGATTYTITNGSASEVRKRMDLIRKLIDQNTLFLMYYSGRTSVNSRGEVEWVFIDGLGLPTSEVNLFLSAVPAKASVLFADSNYGFTTIR
ncbi:MAG TPA: caspase family protein [Bradyrhizobium sp.]|jgi:hypothetical protein|nr:caspase family protein [Bradyrhizobium sp.]